MKKDGYPTEGELNTIQNFDLIKEDVKHLVTFIKTIWWAPDWGFKLSGKKVLRLELHTGGWSGNEEIIGALHRNFLFWSMYWVQSRRGGHYYFRIKKINKRKEW